MTDAINPLVQKALDQAVEKPADATPKTPGAEDVAKFQDAMDHAGPVPGTEAGAAGVQPPPPAGPATSGMEVEPPTLGDAILQGMEKIRDSHEAHAENIQGILNKNGEMTTGDVLRMQMEVTTMSLETELTGTAVDKGDKTIQTLLKEG